MDVNEKGVEASAATGISLVPLTFEIPQVEIFLNRPYLLFIVEKPTQIFSFAAIVNNPLATRKRKNPKTEV